MFDETKRINDANIADKLRDDVAALKGKYANREGIKLLSVGTSPSVAARLEKLQSKLTGGSLEKDYPIYGNMYATTTNDFGNDDQEFSAISSRQ